MLIDVDPYLARLNLGDLPDSWAVRAIFFHPHSASVWRSRAASGKRETHGGILQSYRDALAMTDLGWDTVVSLGAGGGSVDREIAASLTVKTRRYVPVDISWPMCAASAAHLGEVIDVPFGVVTDFEDRFEFLADALRPLESRRTLFCCTGNAIGNLDQGEARFFENLRGMMSPGDHLLLSFATGSFGGEIRRSPAFDQTVFWEALRPLLACSRSAFSGESVADAEDAVEREVTLRPGASDVDGTTTAAFWDTSTERLLLQMRRYDLDVLASWLARKYGFHLLYGSNVDVAASLGSGTLLLCVE